MSTEPAAAQVQDLQAMSFGKRQPTGYRGVERRRAVRERVNLSAEIVLPGDHTLKCRVTDCSSIGARLAVASAFGLPDAFQLRASGGNRHAQVVRRGIGHVAVTFA